jgi:5,10-methylenetetrahydrofolate reductase
MTVVEIETETGVSHELIEEIVRILALTGDVAPAGDGYSARNREARDAASIGSRSGEGLYS